MALDAFVSDFAAGMKAADARRPQAANARSKKLFQPGIGPHTEPQTVALVMAELELAFPDRYGDRYQLEVPYAAGLKACDLCVGMGKSWDWAIEIKMIRFLGDNGKPNEHVLLRVLSPYPGHRSAVTDCQKLLDSGLIGRKALVIYGYDAEDWPLEPAIEAFEILASRRVVLTDRIEASFAGLIHPVHSSGRVLGWEIST